VGENNWHTFFMVMASCIVVLIAACTVATGYRTFDSLSKGEIMKGIYVGAGFCLFGLALVRAFQPSKWEQVDCGFFCSGNLSHPL
jgi:hypothetical protein